MLISIKTYKRIMIKAKIDVRKIKGHFILILFAKDVVNYTKFTAYIKS